MSRIGKKPIAIPAGVDVKVSNGTVTVKGPKGQLVQKTHPNMDVKLENNEVLVARPNDNKENRSLHGLTRSLIANMVFGVTEGFSKELEVNGVGYRVQKQGKDLVMTLGYSHKVIVSELPGITIEAPAQNRIIVSGADKQLVGQVAAEIREKRLPEPYKGKGIKYAGEHIRRKEGKAGAASS